MQTCFCFPLESKLFTTTPLYLRFHYLLRMKMKDFSIVHLDTVINSHLKWLAYFYGSTMTVISGFVSKRWNILMEITGEKKA